MTTPHTTPPVGQVLPAGAPPLLLTPCGEHTGPDGARYERATDAYGAPVLRSHTTGKFYRLGWAQIAALAARAGIDQEDGQ